MLYTALYMAAATRTQIYLTQEQRQRLDEVIDREHRSLAAVIRDAVDEYLDRAAPDLETTLDRTNGALADLSAPAREEWAGREERLWRERTAD
jgi:predicted transcriptional regulator